MNTNITIAEAQKLLSLNNEWIERYKGYADKIEINLDSIKNNRKRFNEFAPLRFYLSMTNANKTQSGLLLDVRYRGQSVASLKTNKNAITISTSKNHDKNNLRDFNCNITLKNTSWQDEKASAFRKFFKDRNNTRNNINKKNEEHNVESLLLTEFSKRKRINKQLTGIKAIKIGNIRFGMPTPISASNHKSPLKYSRHFGGGIDIFARTGGGRSTFITVIEVKDENKSNEPPIYALKQAIQYAVFIRELLRSVSGDEWYKIFGFRGKIPASLKIRAVCAMPDDNPDFSFRNKKYLLGNDEIECHYIYFKYDGKKISNIQSSL